jgi:DNA-binding NarL/FixJ family response regulator
VRIVIAEDAVLLRAGLIRLLADAGHDVVAAVGDATALMQAVEDEKPDIVVTDVRMPPNHQDEGLKAAVELRSRYPQLAILVLSQYVEERYATELLVGDTRGLGYLLKDRVAEVGEFVAAVERVANGGTALDPDVVGQLLARTRRASPLAALTPREREVLQLMAEGRSNTAIAASLVVSEGAVEKHTSSIFSKLGLAPTDAGHRRVLAVLRYLEG